MEPVRNQEARWTWKMFTPRDWASSGFSTVALRAIPNLTLVRKWWRE